MSINHGYCKLYKKEEKVQNTNTNSGVITQVISFDFLPGHVNYLNNLATLPKTHIFWDIRLRPIAHC